MSAKRLLIALVLLVASGVLFASWYFGWLTPRYRGPRLAGPDEQYSNVLPQDYLGPGACAECHQEKYQLWSTHPHRFMNQLPSKDSVKGDFNNHVWTIRPNHTVTFSTRGNDYLMTVKRPTSTTQYRVTRTVGSRFVQFYIGVQTEGPPVNDRTYTVEHKLPFGYWFRMKCWLPTGYFDVTDEYEEPLLEGLPHVVGVDSEASFLSYTDSCVHCHNTYPHAYRIFHTRLAGFFDAEIEPEKKSLSAALSSRFSVEPNRGAFADLLYRIDPRKDLVTVGISCESCHLGGREHARHDKKMSFFPTSPHVHVRATNRNRPFTGEQDNPATSQGTCAQCHSAVAVTTYPNGARIRNSSESLDLMAGACTTEIRCVNCHEPHTPGVPSGGPTLKQHLDACIGCHSQYSSEKEIEAHTRHPAKAGVDCLDCHMLRISQGVDEVSRTHRISQPVEPSMIAAAAPNGCNLCHLDKSVNWTLKELKKGWGREIRPHYWTPTSYLEQPAGKLWLEKGKAMTRMSATEAHARTGRWKSDPSTVLRGLNESNPTNRAYALFAVERILGRRLAADEYDIAAGPRQRQGQIDRLGRLLEKLR